MKSKIIGTVLALTMMVNSNVLQAEESKVLSVLKQYGIPCAVSLIAGFALADKVKNGTAIGVAVCGGLSSYTYVNNNMMGEKRMSDEDMKKMNEIVAASMEKMNIKKEAELDAKILKAEEAQKAKIEELKIVLREVLAERMIKMEDAMKDSVQKQLEQGSLMPTLESNLKEAIKKEVISEVKYRQKDIVEKCVDETIKQVISKPVGVQDNQSGLQDQ